MALGDAGAAASLPGITRPTDLGEPPELAHQDLGRLAEGRLRGRRAVGLDLDRKLVVVRHLADAGLLDLVVHAAHRGEDGVHRHHADRHLLGVLGGPIAHAGLDRQVHLDRSGIGVEREEDEVGIHDLDVGGLADIGGGDRPGTTLHELQRDGVARERAEAQLLDVQDDLGDVFLDVLERAELVEDAVDLDAGDGGPLQGTQEDATQAVAERHAVPLLERGHLEAAQVALRVHLFDVRIGRLWQLWGFKFDHEKDLTPSASSTRRRAAR